MQKNQHATGLRKNFWNGNFHYGPGLRIFFNWRNLIMPLDLEKFSTSIFFHFCPGLVKIFLMWNFSTYTPGLEFFFRYFFHYAPGLRIYFWTKIFSLCLWTLKIFRIPFLSTYYNAPGLGKIFWKQYFLLWPWT